MRTGGRATRRLAAATGVLSLMLATVAVSPAAAQDADDGAQLTPRGIDRVCPVPDDARVDDPAAFDDLGTVHDESIRCAAGYGLVSGFEDGTYRPHQSITRGQMATFVAAWIEQATGLDLPLPDHPDDEPLFDDIAGDVHADAIEALAQPDVQVVSGRTDGGFDPTEPLTRGQFARAIANAISYADVFAVGGPLPPVPDDEEVPFDDVAGTTFEAEIRALAGAGISVGRDGSFHPGRHVTRGQLATFLLRGADYLDRYQRWHPTARVHHLVAELSALADGGQEDSTPDSGRAELRIHAFDGTLAYALDLSDVSGPYADGAGAAIHLGAEGENGPPIVELATGQELDDALAEGDTAIVAGEVQEAESELRFADLVAAPEDAYVLIATNEHPDGAVRGQLSTLE